MARTYDMRTRARRAARTTDRILDAAERLLAVAPVGEVHLSAIAEGAGVSVQTVLRHMGSRDGCLAEVRRRVAERVERQRGGTPPGDVPAALTALFDHYEAEGRLMLNLLAQEAGGDDLVRAAAAEGRAYHRAWVRRCLLGRSPSSDAPGEDARSDPSAGADGARADAPRNGPRDDVALEDALVAATDLYVWKLLRLDLGRPRQAAEAAVSRAVRALLEAR